MREIETLGANSIDILNWLLKLKFKEIESSILRPTSIAADENITMLSR